MTTQVFDFAKFQALFPALSAVTAPQASAWWDAANSYIAQPNSRMPDATLNLALNLMTAHLAQSFTILSTGSGLVGPVTSAGEGSVNVSVAPPPARSAWGYWLATTPYGLQLSALLGVQSAGGAYIGGSPERGAFRKVGGVF